MKRKTIKINQIIDDKIRNACGRIPQQKRKFVVLGLCLSFIVVFTFMIWKSFHNDRVQKLMKIEHITPLDLQQDSLSLHFKKYFNGK